VKQKPLSFYDEYQAKRRKPRDYDAEDAAAMRKTNAEREMLAADLRRLHDQNAAAAAIR